MPIYEFVCKKCGGESEILVASSNWKGTECPKCGSKKLEKKFSVFAASVASQTPPSSCGTSPSACCGCPNNRHNH